MSLTLPGDLEPWIDTIEDAFRPGAYALVLDRPEDFPAAWDRLYDIRPEWFSLARECETLAYVGGASDVLSRLEDHRDGEVRRTVLTSVCDIDHLHTVLWATDRPYSVVEYNLAVTLSRERDGWYVHSR